MQITSGIVPKAIKCVVYGPEGIGKSTFASKAPNPVFCDVEDSTLRMDVRRLPKPSSVQMILDEIAYVRANPHLCDTFVLDTGDWTERLCRELVCSKYGKSGIEDFGYGKGFSYVYEEFGRIINALEGLIDIGINVIMNCHAVMRKFEQPDENGAYDRWELKLNNSPKCSVANMVKEWADIVLFANYETFVVKNEEKKNKVHGGRRVMYTCHHPCWDAKNRFGLAEKLPFDFAQVEAFFVRKSSATQSLPATEAYSKNESIRRARSSRPTEHDSERSSASGMPRATGAEKECEQAVTARRDPTGVRAGLSLSQSPTATGRTASSAPTEDVQTAGADMATPLRIEKAEQMTIISESDDDFPFDVVIPEGIPKALADLMRHHVVSEPELTKVVAQKGYFPADMPLNRYPKDFIDGVLVGAWDQVHAMVKANRNQ